MRKRRKTIRSLASKNKDRARCTRHAGKGAALIDTSGLPIFIAQDVIRAAGEYLKEWKIGKIKQ